MSFLTDNEKQIIRNKIAEVEKGTQGEIITVLANTSDNYLYIPTLWAALLALSIPGINFLFNEPLHSVLLYQVQVLIFILASFLFQLQKIKMHLIPQRIKHYRASLVAHEQFIAHGLHRTKNRTGILIYVSVGERYVEIIADEGINSKIESHFWQEIIDEFTNSIKRKQVCNGFVYAIEHCRVPLWEHFPADSGKNPNELPNHLIEI